MEAFGAARSSWRKRAPSRTPDRAAGSAQIDRMPGPAGTGKLREFPSRAAAARGNRRSDSPAAGQHDAESPVHGPARVVLLTHGPGAANVREVPLRSTTK